MGSISSIYMNQACIDHAKKIRDLNKARQQRQDDRQARRNARLAAKALRKAKEAPEARRSAKSAGLIIVEYTQNLGPEFYLTREWKELRYRALKLRGARCQCCGSTQGPLHVDHIKPRSRFPALELTLGNLQVLCQDCNVGKGAWDSTDWRNKNGAIT